MFRLARLSAFVIAVSVPGFAGQAPAQQPPAGPSIPAVTYIEQGWSPAQRDSFYTTSQGSRIMPLSWFAALKHADGQPFLADGLARYGYLPNARSPSNPQGLPVGFTLDMRDQQPYIGMTCAACHTRQITVQGQPYRIDGGPAIADFEALLRDIQSSVRTVLSDADTSPVFAEFAQAVLGPADTPQARVALRLKVTQWFAGYDTLLASALSGPDWGLDRIDAIGMIFNRVTGLDLNIWTNIKPADAPVRYPFLWNASRQDKTQWPGFAQNGLDVEALARNTGEALGVFAWFSPTAQSRPAPDLTRRADYLRGSSPDFAGLQQLETDIRALAAPKWPSGWPVRDDLQTAGAQIFGARCAECHEEKAASVPGTWKTPVRNVHTDPKAWNNLQRKAASGALAGTRQPPLLGSTLADPDTAKNILANAVVGILLDDLKQHTLPTTTRRADGVWQAAHSDLIRLGKGDADIQSANPTVVVTTVHDQLTNLFHPTGADPGPAYEARVLSGIWAAAPYLHNGSVPTLAELLKPSSQRVKSFKIGSNYDPDAVGLAADQGAFASTYQVGDCDGVSGNGNCGHEYGTDLSPADQKALLEYLKRL